MVTAFTYELDSIDGVSLDINLAEIGGETHVVYIAAFAQTDRWQGFVAGLNVLLESCYVGLAAEVIGRAEMYGGGEIVDELVCCIRDAVRIYEEEE